MTAAKGAADRHRRRSPALDRFAAGGGPSDFHLLATLVPNDPEARTVLRKEAARRGLSVEGIIRRVVDAVIADRLFAAVLDDAGEVGTNFVQTSARRR